MERTDLVAILKRTLVFKGSEVIVIGVRPMPLLKCLRYLNESLEYQGTVSQRRATSTRRSEIVQQMTRKIIKLKISFSRSRM